MKEYQKLVKEAMLRPRLSDGVRKLSDCFYIYRFEYCGKSFWIVKPSRSFPYNESFNGDSPKDCMRYVGEANVVFCQPNFFVAFPKGEESENHCYDMG